MLYGQSIFSNSISTNNPNTDNPYTIGQIVDANITVSGIGRGPDINGNNGNNRYNARDWNLGAFDSGDYFYFTLTPNASYEIDFINFEYTGETSAQGPINIEIRSSIDNYTSSIGTPTITGSTIDLSSSTYQNITTTITFRVYAWGGGHTNGTFSINDFVFNGTVTFIQCPIAATWNGSSWDNGTGPNISIGAIIDGNYSTLTHGNFTACNLTINSGNRLTVSNSSYIEIENDVTVDGEIIVESQGNFVQNDDNSLFTLNTGGNSLVRKNTSPLNNWYDYTYWSSPVKNAVAGTALFSSDRRYWFNSSNYEDALAEIGNTGSYGSGQDDIDDDGNDWQVLGASDILTPGVGYAATHSQIGFLGPGFSYDYDFSGEFNNGVIQVPIIQNNTVTADNDWNFIGNPYASAIDFNTFYTANSGLINGVAYLWSHNTNPSGSIGGNAVYNFSQSDYAIITSGSGNTAGADGIIPNDYIPSGQGFFVIASGNGNASFNNSMRVADNSSNSQFFKSASSKTKNQANKLWINLTSDNGIFNQILIAYVDGATEGYDGMAYDATRNFANKMVANIYTKIDGEDKNFVIQGKDIHSLDLSESISIGFNSSIDTPTIYNLSIAQLQGDFLNSNPIYLKDNLLNKMHNLSDSDYSFTSNVGEYNERFKIVFTTNSLSADEVSQAKKSFRIVELDGDNVQFSTSNNLKIKSIEVYDLLGRALYNFKVNSSSEAFNISKLNSSVFIAKVELSNGAIITKKAIKK